MRRTQKICEITTLDLSYVVTVKSAVEISRNFVAFSQYMNFTFKISINQNMVGIHFVGIEFVENRFFIVGQSVYSQAIIVFPWTHFRNTSAIWYEMAQTDQSFARNQNSRIR